MNLKAILNKSSPWAHMESEFDVFGVSEKLVKNVVFSSQRKKLKKNLFFSAQAIQTTINYFLVSRNFRN
jgi:hypothetical protein